MYLEFYGLKYFPFNITSNPELFFEADSHKEALAALLYGIQEKKGIILITGEVGTGKTTLCKMTFPEHQKIGDILVERGEAKHEDISKAVAMQKPLGEVLVETKVGTPEKVDLALAEQKILSERREQRAKAASNIKVSADKLDYLINLVG